MTRSVRARLAASIRATTTATGQRESPLNDRFQASSLFRTIRLLPVPLLLILTIPSAASAEEARAERFYLTVDGFPGGLELDTKLRVDGSAGRGSLIDFEDELRLDDSVERVRVSLGFPLGERHEIELSYLEVSRTEEASAGRTFQIGNREFSAGFELRTRLETADIEIGYKYYLLRSDRSDFGFSLGLHGVLAEVDVRGRAGASVGQNQPREFDVQEREESDVPLPVLGLHGSHQFHPRWLFDGSIKAFGLVEVDRYSGEFFELRLGIEHLSFKHVGFGFGLYWTRLEVDAEFERRLELGSFEYEQLGGRIFSRLRF